MKKLSNDGRKGGLLVGKTDIDGGIGIPATVGGSRHVILGGGEIIINEAAANKHCETLSKINESTGGRHINCDDQPTANKGKYSGGGYIPYPGSDKAKVQGSVVGKKAKLNYIKVKPSEQKEGVGRSEVLKFEQWAKDNGAEVVEIDVYKTSVGFWEKMGYTVEKDFPVIDGHKQDYKDGYKILKMASGGLASGTALNSFQQLALMYNGK